MRISLYNEDCLNVLLQLPDKSIDVIVTDPPYGLGEWVGRKKGRSRIAIAREWGRQDWDDKIPDPVYFEEMFRVSKNQVIFGGNHFVEHLKNSPCWLVWDKHTTGNFADCELAWTSFDTTVRKIDYMWNGMFQGSAGGNMKLNEKRLHPTQKPLPVMEWIIANYTQPGDLIADIFMGSGTTGVACANFGRSFIGVEKEKHFFQIAEQRIQSASEQLQFIS
jgi:site-specific DNA-methyltransferase (adenine-specific)